MRLNVNPTRMELSRLKTRYSFAKRGHKLLKNKEDELIRRFLDLLDKDKIKREEMEEKLSQNQRFFAQAAASLPLEDLREALMFNERSCFLESETKRVLNLEMANFIVQEKDGLHHYRLSSTNAALDESLKRLAHLLPLMIEVASLEHSIIVLARDIERTRRRVNALEYRLIPELEETINYIEMKLSEMERSNLSRLMRLKELA